MPSRSFSDISQNKWIRACKKLGLTVKTCYGKGSHAKVTHPKTHGAFTIQSALYNIVNIKIFKKLLEWGFSEDEIWKALQ